MPVTTCASLRAGGVRSSVGACAPAELKTLDEGGAVAVRVSFRVRRRLGSFRSPPSRADFPIGIQLIAAALRPMGAADIGRLSAAATSGLRSGAACQLLANGASSHGSTGDHPFPSGGGATRTRSL